MISYTMPCHKRQADLEAVLPSVLSAASTYVTAGHDIEVIVVDYGNDPFLELPHNVRSVISRGSHFHMAHARNVGIRYASGDIICAFVCDQVIQPEFFHVVNRLMRPGVFLAWQETFVFYKDDILAAGGFNEQFELYGPEGKELAERLERRGLTKLRIPHDLVYQIPTSYKDKICNYRAQLSRREMHHIGMDTWKECAGLLVANEGKEWGAPAGPEYRTYSDAYIQEIKQRIEAKIREHEERMMQGVSQSVAHV